MNPTPSPLLVLPQGLNHACRDSVAGQSHCRKELQSPAASTPVQNPPPSSTATTVSALLHTYAWYPRGLT